jgi:hypothetical protein
LSFSDLIGDFGTLESGVGMEHLVLVRCSSESPVIVLVSVLYWELEGYWKLERYWKLEGYEVELCPVLKEVISGL